MLRSEVLVKRVVLSSVLLLTPIAIVLCCVDGGGCDWKEQGGAEPIPIHGRVEGLNI